jgi:carotenoid cleavage dioxygenase-like enzyme
VEVAAESLYEAAGLALVIDDRGDEFPRINGRHGGQAYNFIYTAHWGDDVAFGPAMKHDVQHQTTEVHDYGQGRKTAEPVFVRKPGAAAEGEGWIMSYVHGRMLQR